MFPITDQLDLNLAQLLGEKLAQTRKHRQLSQHQLAQGICSQSMISSIEQGRYVPNAILLAKLCQRLAISMDHFFLKDHLTIDQFTTFNDQIKTLCDQHRYPELQAYLATSAVIKHLYHDTDYQIYYYYYGVTTYQVTHDAHASLRYLTLALNYTITKRQTVVTTNELLIKVTIATLMCRTHQVTTGLQLFATCLNHVQVGTVNGDSENIAILFYQYGLALYRNGDFKQAAKLVTLGINWVTAKSTHYMLSDLFFLLSKIYTALNHPEAAAAHHKSQVLDDIFGSTAYQF